jgi:hypothetical protein
VWNGVVLMGYKKSPQNRSAAYWRISSAWELYYINLDKWLGAGALTISLRSPFECLSITTLQRQ